MFCSVSKNLEDGTILQYFMIWGALNNISVSKICKYKSFYTDLYSVCQEIESKKPLLQCVKNGEYGTMLDWIQNWVGGTI